METQPAPEAATSTKSELIEPLGVINFDTAVKRLEGSQSYGECLCRISDMVIKNSITPSVMGELVIHCYKKFIY